MLAAASWAIAVTLAMAVFDGSLWAQGSSLFPERRGAGGGRSIGLPVADGFIENRGQWPAEELFVGRIGAAVIRVRPDGLWLQPEASSRASEGGRVLAIEFETCRGQPRGSDSASSHVNFLEGDDPAGWLRRVPVFREIRWEGANLASAVRLTPTELRIGGKLPGSDVARLRFRGTTGCQIVERTGAIDVLIGPDAGFSVSVGSPATRRPILVSHGDRGDSVTMSNVGGGEEWWITYIGGSGSDGEPTVDLDSLGNVVVAGDMESADFPTTTGPIQVGAAKLRSVYIAKFAITGELLYSTVFGGTEMTEVVKDLHVMKDDSILLTGWTGLEVLAQEMDFPLSPTAFDKVPELADCFVAHLDSSAEQILGATFLGGGATDWGWCVTEGMDGSVVVAGETVSSDFPTSVDAYDTAFGILGQDGFVACLSGDLSTLHIGTYLGGVFVDSIRALDIDNDDTIIVGTRTTSSDFPTTPGAFQEIYAGTGSLTSAVSRLSADGKQLLASTYLTGGGQVDALKIMSDGTIAVAGITGAESLPTTPGAFKTTLLGSDNDAYVIRFDSALAEVVYGTFLGGTSPERLPLAMDVTPSGAIAVIGQTVSVDFPTTKGSLQQQYMGPPFVPSGAFEDAFIVLLHPDGSDLLYSTYFGGTGGDASLDRAGIVFNDKIDCAVAMATQSADAPVTPNAAFPLKGGLTDGLVALLPMLPEGVTKYGSATPGPDGPPALGVLSMPEPGNVRFGVTCSSAPPDAVGLLLVSVQAQATPVAVKGIALWVDPAQLIAILPMAADDLGWSEVNVPIPPDATLIGASGYVQAIWPTGGPGSPLVASNALAIVVQ